MNLKKEVWIVIEVRKQVVSSNQVEITMSVTKMYQPVTVMSNKCTVAKYLHKVFFSTSSTFNTYFGWYKIKLYLHMNLATYVWANRYRLIHYSYLAISSWFELICFLTFYCDPPTSFFKFKIYISCLSLNTFVLNNSRDWHEKEIATKFLHLKTCIKICFVWGKLTIM